MLSCSNLKFQSGLHWSTHLIRQEFLVVDPGFPRGGCSNLSFGKKFAENCMKMHETWPRVGTHPWNPLWIRHWIYNRFMADLIWISDEKKRMSFIINKIRYRNRCFNRLVWTGLYNVITSLEFPSLGNYMCVHFFLPPIFNCSVFPRFYVVVKSTWI